MKISEMQRVAHETAENKGWWDDIIDLEAHVPVLLCLVHSEVSEALEDFREGKMLTTIREDGKPEGLPSELADVVIRVGDMCGALGIDLEFEVEQKMAHNANRKHRHGGKRI